MNREEDNSIYFNPWDPQFRANPYPLYKRLLAGSPKLLDVFLPMALIARYDDCIAVLNDVENFSNVEPRVETSFGSGFDIFEGASTVLFSDPPAHTRLRRLVSRAFAPRRIHDLEPRIRKIAADLVDKIAGKSAFDVMADLANPLPVMVIAEILGIPAGQYQAFKHWSDVIITSDNVIPGAPIPEEIQNAAAELRAYFTEEIARRRGKPGSDLLSVLIEAHEENESLTEQELLAFVILLLLAGNETTTNLIGNGMLALGRHPGQLELLREEPALMTSAINEMLRYDPPAQSTVRWPAREIETLGLKLRPHTAVFVILAAANRDPLQFSEPERFDIQRDPNEHLSFGHNIHYCLGASLARLEASIAIGTLLECFPKLRLADPRFRPVYKGSYFLRGVSALPMAID